MGRKDEVVGRVGKRQLEQIDIVIDIGHVQVRAFISTEALREQLAETGLGSEVQHAHSGRVATLQQLLHDQELQAVPLQGVTVGALSVLSQAR